MELPDDIVLIVFNYLDFKEIISLCLISKTFNFSLLSKDDKFWRLKFEQLLIKFDFLKDNYQNLSYKDSIIKMKSDIIESTQNIQPDNSLREYHNYQRLLALPKIKSSEFVSNTDGNATIAVFNAIGNNFDPGPRLKKEWVHHNQKFQAHLKYYGVKSNSQAPSNCNLIIICFSIAKISQDLLNIESEYQFLKKIIDFESESCPNVKWLLVGTNSNIKRNNTNFGVYSYQDCVQLARKLKCISYVEVATHTGEGFEDLWNLIHIICHYKRIRTSWCVIQ